MCVCEIGLIADGSNGMSAPINLRKHGSNCARHRIDMVLSRSGPAEQLSSQVFQSISQASMALRKSVEKFFEFSIVDNGDWFDFHERDGTIARPADGRSSHVLDLQCGGSGNKQ